MSDAASELVKASERLPATVDELQAYVADKKARYEGRRALIRAVPDSPGAEEYKNAAIDAAVLDIGLGWEAMAKIGDFLPAIEASTGGRPRNDEKPTIGEGRLSDRHYRLFARACQRARDNGKLDGFIDAALNDRKLPRWTAPLGGSLVEKMTGETENYTPAWLIEKIRKVLGAIDLDPASSDMAQETVQASQYFTAQDDGLSKPWAGRIFLNPPYTARVINQFVAKLLSELPHIKAAILLTNDSTDTQWFRSAVRSCRVVCFPGRIHFYTVDGIRTQPTNGQALFYFGDARDEFAMEFAETGPVMVIYA